jgi:hypothetical protein
MCFKFDDDGDTDEVVAPDDWQLEDSVTACVPVSWGALWWSAPDVEDADEVEDVESDDGAEDIESDGGPAGDVEPTGSGPMSPATAAVPSVEDDRDSNGSSTGDPTPSASSDSGCTVASSGHGASVSPGGAPAIWFWVLTVLFPCRQRRVRLCVSR